jgi:predicted nucleic acid-binding Zn ribbon protein
MSAERELTGGERAAIKKLVVSMCANYDSKYGCLPLDYGRCYMLDKWWTGAYCKYFRDAVLPLDPALEAALLGRAMPVVETQPCAVCGKPFPAKGNKLYCSARCAKKSQRRQQRAHMRKKRDEC